jgi:hypothetical protein
MSRERALRVAGASGLVIGFVLVFSTPVCPLYYTSPGGSPNPCVAAQTWLAVASGLAILAGAVLPLVSLPVPARAT